MVRKLQDKLIKIKTQIKWHANTAEQLSALINERALVQKKLLAAMAIEGAKRAH